MIGFRGRLGILIGIAMLAAAAAGIFVIAFGAIVFAFVIELDALGPI